MDVQEPRIEIYSSDDLTKTMYFPNITNLEFNFGMDYLDKPASKWAISKIGTLEAKIQMYLGTRKRCSNFISNKADDIPLHRLLIIAKESFGHDGWRDEVIDITVVSTEEKIDESGEPRYTIQMESIIRIELKDGTYHDDVGYGRADNLPSKSFAYSKAKKEAITDGKRRGLQNLKNILFDYEDKRRRGEDVYTNVFK